MLIFKSIEYKPVSHVVAVPLHVTHVASHAENKLIIYIYNPCESAGDMPVVIISVLPHTGSYPSLFGLHPACWELEREGVLLTVTRAGVVMVSVLTRAGSYPSLSRLHPACWCLEREGVLLTIASPV